MRGREIEEMDGSFRGMHIRNNADIPKLCTMPLVWGPVTVHASYWEAQ